MKGNYYLFSPELDEKGEQVYRGLKKNEFYETNEFPFISVPFYRTSAKYPILTIKKFDHDPFERIKKVYEAIKSLDPTYPESGEESVKYQLILFALGNAAVKAISETVKELEGR